MLRHVGRHPFEKVTAIEHILKFKAANHFSAVSIAGIFGWNQSAPTLLILEEMLLNHSVGIRHDLA